MTKIRPSDTPGDVDWAAMVLLVGTGIGLSSLGTTQFLSGAGFGTEMLDLSGISYG
ncbi:MULTISPECIES: hypothetical protein [unclassified Haloferax]|uniref:hypothetical protein n=1 Tax=unclassified Haloferax TaxID=2625095 RepID=UPI0013143417|nr:MULTISPECIES: hypothetical protein [unclassified Haloferax]